MGATADPVQGRLAWSGRRVLLGDWHWLIRDPLDVLRYAFIAGAIAYAVMGRAGSSGLIAASVLLLVARIVNLPRWFDFSVIAAMALIAWGTAFSLYGDYYFYDNLVHGVSPFFYTPVLYLALARLGVLPEPEDTRGAYQYAGVFVTTLALGMAVGAGYEIVEWLSDSLLGTHFVKSTGDTGSDLLEGALGSLAAASLVTVWSVRRWPSRRTTTVAVPARMPRLSEVVLALRQRLTDALPGQARLGQLPSAARAAVDIAGGVLLLALPSPAFRTIQLVIGIALLAQATIDLLTAVRGSRASALGGVALKAALGVVVLAWPGISQDVFLYAAGASAIVLALLEAAAQSAGHYNERDRWLGGAASATSFVFGVALLASPNRSFDAVIAILGLYLCIAGVFRLIRSLPIGRAAAVD